MKKLDTTLTATVTRCPGTGKCHTVTHVIIWAGNIIVAKTGGKPLGGKYDEAWALKEFKNNPNRFVPGPGWFIVFPMAA